MRKGAEGRGRAWKGGVRLARRGEGAEGRGEVGEAGLVGLERGSIYFLMRGRNGRRWRATF